LVELNRATLQANQTAVGLGSDASIIYLEQSPASTTSLQSIRAGSIRNITPKGLNPALQALEGAAQAKAGYAASSRAVHGTLIVDGADGVVLFAIQPNGQMKLWLGKDELAPIDSPPRLGCWGTAFSAGGFQVAFYTEDGKLLVADSLAGKLRQEPSLDWVAGIAELQSWSGAASARCFDATSRVAVVSKKDPAGVVLRASDGSSHSIQYGDLLECDPSGAKRSKTMRSAAINAPWLLAREGRSAPLDLFSEGAVIHLPVAADTVIFLDTLYY
jgi:hypothetical protein